MAVGSSAMIVCQQKTQLNNSSNLCMISQLDHCFNYKNYNYDELDKCVYWAYDPQKKNPNELKYPQFYFGRKENRK